VVALIGGEFNAIVRVEHLGYVARKDVGISIMFAEAPHVLPSSRISDATTLHVNCFHLHCDGYEGRLVAVASARSTVSPFAGG